MVIRRETGDLNNFTPNPKFEPTPDPRLAELLPKAMERKIPVTRRMVRLEDIHPYDPGLMGQIRKLLREEPRIRKAVEEALQQRAYPRVVLYRDHEGRLIMSDDYALCAVASELGISEVRALILGEGTEKARPSDFTLLVVPKKEGA